MATKSKRGRHDTSRRSLENKRQGPVVGIDPGLTGAAAVIGPDGHSIDDLPILRVHSKGYLDSYALRNWIMQWGPRLIVIELAGSRQMQGVASISQNWLTYGGVVATAMTLDCPVEIVSPLKWKRALGLIGKDKEASRAKALKLYPTLADMLKRKMDHNRAEAVLLAHWGLSVH